MRRTEERDRPTVERRDPPHAEPLRDGDQRRVREPWPVLGGRLEVLAGAPEVGVGGRDETDRRRR